MDLYLLTLATKLKSEVLLPPAEALLHLSRIERHNLQNSEARARASVLMGLFNAFECAIEGPVLHYRPRIGKLAITERIDEILQDAYLLDASRLRRFLGVKSNVASVKRDLHKLLSYISSNRRWAKGLFSVGSITVIQGLKRS